MADDENTLVSFGDSIKSLGDGKFGGYLVRFSSESDPDLTDEYFTSDTDYDIDLPAKSTVYFNHGMDSVLKRRKLGRADLKKDDVGIWAEFILQERDDYEKKLIELASAGKLGWSSGTASHLVEREGKHITRWPLGLDASITHTPAEPRNTVISLKSLMSVQSVQDPAKAASSAQETAQDTKSTGVINMEIEDTKLQEMLDKSADKAVKAFIAAQPSEHVADVQVGSDEADRALAGNPFKTAQEYFVAVKNAGVYPSEMDRRLLPLKATGLNEAIPSQGGFLVPPTMASGILEGMYATGSLLNQFNRIPVQGNSMTFNAVDETSRVAGSRWGGVTGYWMAEAGTKTASKPTFRQLEIKLQKVAALCVATDELLEDAAALTAWLQKTVPLELKFKVEDAIVNGDGVGKPLGVMNSAALKTISTRVDAAEIDVVDLGNMWAGRASEFNDYIWLVSPRAFPQLLNLSIGNTPVFLPGGSVAGLPGSTLFGRPMFETEYNAALGTVGDIILMSPAAYPMIEKSGGVQSATSIHVYFGSDESAFRFVYRVGGAPAWYTTRTEKDASTTSPFVVLSAST